MKRDKEGREACPSSPLPADAIEEFVVERLREVTGDAQLAAEVMASVKERVVARRKDLRIERKKLPVEIAALAAEGKRLVETIVEVSGPARRLVDERLQEVGNHLARCEARLTGVEHEIGNLDSIELESTWMARCLADFDAVWDVLTPENRGRLLRAVVERVEVDEPANRVSVFMADLDAAPVSAPVPQEVVA